LGLLGTVAGGVSFMDDKVAELILLHMCALFLSDQIGRLLG
jgi:hypothetical protein